VRWWKAAAGFCAWMSGAHAVIALMLDQTLITVLAIGGAVCASMAYIGFADAPRDEEADELP
jgi:hypothetical protein